MTVSSIAGTQFPGQNAVQGLSQQRRSDLQSLLKNLNSGDMSGARHALAALQASFQGVLQSQAGGGPQTGNNTPVQRDLAAIGKALGSDDLAGAKQGLASLMRDLQGADARRPATAAAPGGGIGPAGGIDLTA